MTIAKIQTKRSWLRRLRFCYASTLGRQRGVLRSIKQRAPKLYRMLKVGTAQASVDPDGEIVEIHSAFENINDSDVAFLSALPNLKHLRLQFCQQLQNGVFQHLGGTRQLRSLNLDGALVSGYGLVHLQGHRDLEALSLAHTCLGTTSVEDLRTVPEPVKEQIELMQTAGLSHLSAFPQLRELDLDSTEVGDAAMETIAQLKNLEYLSVMGTRVTDAGLKHLYGHPRLELVLLKGSRVTAAGVEELKQHLPAGCDVW